MVLPTGGSVHLAAILASCFWHFSGLSSDGKAALIAAC